MNGKTAVQRHRKLTEKGQATRARILEQAAELIHTKGVAATNNEQLRRVTGISGSQLNHYFPTKESLVMAVIEWQTEQVMRFYGSEQFAGFDTIGRFDPGWTTTSPTRAPTETAAPSDRWRAR